MKFAVAVLFVSALATQAVASEVSPIEKVIEMISDLEAKVIKEGDDAQQIYDEFSEFCEDRSRQLGFEIKTGKAEVAELSATIEEETAASAALETKIEELSDSIKTDEADLKAATEQRDREAADFAAEEKELTEVISMLERAVAILSREMAKQDGASFLQSQLKNVKNLVEAFQVMVQASAISSADASRLTALVQTSSDSDSDDEDPGAPAAAVYENHSGGIIETLEGLLEKAESQLDKARKTETTNLHNYQMLKQSLDDSMKFANKDMDAAKKGLSESQEKKATAEGDLEVTQKDLDEDIKAKADLHSECMDGATEFELTTKSRGEELKALATAKKVIKETTGGAAEQEYGLNQVSFLQLKSSADLAKAEAVRFVRDLARKTNAPALAQLAARMSSAIRLGTAAGDDPFAKVEGLIKDMIATLEAEAAEDASHKAYCDKELGETNAKKADLTAASDKLSTKIAQDSAASTKLKEEVATLQKDLAEMAAALAEATKVREEEKAAYETNSKEMALGIEGVKKALSVLKDYYAQDNHHEAAEGAASGIIGLLEVCESDFTKSLTEMTASEESAAADYEKYVKENEIATTEKQQAVKYKTQEAATLDKNIADLTTDLETVTEELNAVNEALEKLEAMCVEKAETYEEKKARRDAEIAGLKEALEILNGVSLIQKTTMHHLRGAQHA
jgi:DNA repair exonuclease SbcCD ATPase subunit